MSLDYDPRWPSPQPRSTVVCAIPSSTSTGTWPSTSRPWRPTSSRRVCRSTILHCARLLPPYGGHRPRLARPDAQPSGPPPGRPRAVVELAGAQTIDLATALFPDLLYERLDELGIDFGVVYPSLGLVFLHTRDETLPPGHVPRPQPVQRRDVRTVGRSAHAGGRHPDAHPRRGRGRARLRGRSSSGSRRCCAPGTCSVRSKPLADKDPEVARYAFWLDQFGIDSRLRLRPGVGQAAQELGVSVAFHSGFIGHDAPTVRSRATCTTTSRCWPKGSSRWPSRCSSAGSPAGSRT